MPAVRTVEQSRVAPATLYFIMNDLIQQYIRSEGVINDENNILNEQLLIRLYNRMLVNDSDRYIII